MPPGPWPRVGCECAPGLCCPRRNVAWKRTPGVPGSSSVGKLLLLQFFLSCFEGVGYSAHPIRIIAEVPKSSVAGVACEAPYASTARFLAVATSVVVVNMHTTRFPLVQRVTTQVAAAILRSQQITPLTNGQVVLVRDPVVGIALLPTTGCLSIRLRIHSANLPGHLPVVRLAYLRVVPVDTSLLGMLPTGTSFGALLLRCRGVLEASAPRHALRASSHARILCHASKIIRREFRAGRRG